MEMNQYLFGYELRYLCETCPGAAYNILPHNRVGTLYECPLCVDPDILDNYLVPERYYKRWK